jgi:hypothetical protein
MIERKKWSCDKYRTERFRRLQDKLQNALRQIDELKSRNRELENYNWRELERGIWWQNRRILSAW